MPLPDATTLAAAETLHDLHAYLPDRILLYPNHTASFTGDLVRERAGELERAGIRAGEPVAIPLANDTASVTMLLAMLQIGARPLILTADSPHGEVARLRVLCGCGRSLVPDRAAASDFRIVGEAGDIVSGAPGVFLPTSGSTGQAKLVFRTQASLIDEALRYVHGLGISSADRIVIPLPVSHAYALGWLAAALVGGAAIVLIPPSALGAVAQALADGATILVLTPTLARLLASRTFPPSISPPFLNLRFAMAGAGPVDDQLDEVFQARFGLRLARNYGSSETGALFAGLPPLPPRCVGTALPSIRFRITDDAGQDCPPERPGRIKVAGPASSWHDMGDVGFVDAGGRLTLLGRGHQGARRGDRWVSLLEVEEALRLAPSVHDVHVRAVRMGAEGNDRITAEVVPVRRADFDAEALLRFAAGHLASYKLPDRVLVRRSLRRNSAGKVGAPPTYQPGAPDAIAAAARAYKRSELAIALADLGVFSALDGHSDLMEVSIRLGLSYEELGAAMEIAEALGLVVRAGAVTSDPSIAPRTFDPMPFLRLEAEISRSLTTRETIAETLRVGETRRKFDREGPEASFVPIYGHAMHGPHVRGRTLMALRAAHLAKGARALEVTAGPGRYLEAILRADAGASGTLLPLGSLAGRPAEALSEYISQGRLDISWDPPEGTYDLCIAANIIHGPAPGDDLAWLWSRLRPGGRLVIDDIFLPAVGADAEIGLDWLTHGGLAFRTAQELKEALEQLSGEVSRASPPGDHLTSIFIITKEKA